MIQRNRFVYLKENGQIQRNCILGAKVIKPLKRPSINSAKTFGENGGLKKSYNPLHERERRVRINLFLSNFFIIFII